MGIASGDRSWRMILFGQSFLEGVAKTSAKTRDARLRRIEKALSLAVPQFRQLPFIKDVITGRPHLEALYTHHRPNAGWQREEHFSEVCWEPMSLGSLRTQNGSMIPRAHY